MGELPSGVVTFVFTDIEDSTPLFERLGERYRSVHARHHGLLRKAFAAHGGHEMRTEGDSFFVVFGDPVSAVMGCVDAQRALAAEPWPEDGVIRVRMGVHAGPATPADGEYTALAVHAAARVMAAGSGGQIVVSEIVKQMASGAAVDWVDTGPHRLRGLAEPFRLFLVRTEGAPNDERPLRTARVMTSNVPLVAEPLIGRDDILAELEQLVEQNRCLTLTGTGGVGKTRLALHVAADTGDRFPDGSWFVDLHSLRSDDEVATSAAALLQTQTDGLNAPVDAVVRAIEDGHVLVVLDNCEHVLEGAGELASALVARCPNATVLATSREPLGIRGEVSWRVPSLALDAGVELMVARVAVGRGKFDPTDADRDSLRQIAQRLGGIPLALELAASRCSTMSPADVASRLSERFRLLSGGGRASLSRHQTLEAAVAWSFDLLDDHTKRVFRRLSVFAGGWTLAEAESVVGFDGLDALDVDDAVGALVDKSLVIADFAQQPARYEFLETIRQFARSELVRADEANVAQDRHVDTFCDLVETLDAAIPGPGENEAMARVEVELENVRTALAWAEDRERHEDLCRLTAAAADAALNLGRGPDVSAWTQRALALAETRGANVRPETVAKLYIAAAKADWAHRPNEARTVERLELACSLLQTAPGDLLHERAVASGWLATYLLSRGEFDRALALLRDLIASLDDDEAIKGVLTAVYGSAFVEYSLDPVAGRAALREALVRSERTGTTRGTIVALQALSLDAALRGDADEVEALSQQLGELTARLPKGFAAEVLGDAAIALVRVNRFEQAEEFARRSVEAATASGVSETVVQAGVVAGEAAAAAGDWNRAQREWAAVAELAGRHSRVMTAMLARYRLRLLASMRGDTAYARRMVDESRGYAEVLGGMPWVAWHLQDAEVRLAEGDSGGAAGALHAAIDLAVRPVHAAHFAGSAADLCFEAGLLDEAVRLAAFSYAGSSHARQRASSGILAARRREQRDTALQRALAADRHAELAEAGRALTTDDLHAAVEQLLAAWNS